MSILDRTLQKSALWLDEIKTEFHLNDEDEACAILRAVLHALRDRLTTDESAQLAAQLPIFIRGLYFEGWNPSAKPIKDKSRKFLFEYIRKSVPGYPALDPEKAACAVFALLSEHISQGEIRDVKSGLPDELKSLWPTPMQNAVGS